MNTKRTRAPTSKKAVEQRKKLFAKEVVRNGGNGTKAAIAVGYSPHTAHVAASRLLSEVNVNAAVQAGRARQLEAADINLERTRRELARIAYFDPASLFDAKGKRIPIHELDPDTRAAIASLDHEQITVGKGKTAKTIGHTEKIRIWDKGGALDKLVKMDGGYEIDNRQKRPDLSIQIAVVSPGSKE